MNAPLDQTAGPRPATPVTGQGTAVLTVESSLRDNGGLRVLLDYADRWGRAGAVVDTCVLQDVVGEQLAPVPEGSTVRFLSGPGVRFRYGAVPALARLIHAARRSNVVLSGSEIGNAVLAAYVAAKVARKPFAILLQSELDDSIRSWVGRPLRRLTRRINRRADLVICVSDGLVAGAAANGTPRDRIRVVPVGIDVEAVRARGAVSKGSRDRCAGDGVPIVVACGRLCSQKDFDVLIRAHAAALESGVDHRLEILGDGPDRPALERLVAELGVGDTVRLVGHLPDPLPRMAAADLFVLSSRTEGLPLVLLEALALQLPIVSTRCGNGAQGVLQDGRLAAMVPVGSVTDLAAAVTQHLVDPDVLRDRARHGLDRARDFDVRRSATKALVELAALHG